MGQLVQVYPAVADAFHQPLTFASDQSRAGRGARQFTRGTVKAIVVT